MSDHFDTGCCELVKQTPNDEFTIMSLSRNDPVFRAICEDFGEALIALRRFQAKGMSGQARAEEFLQISEDLRLELMEFVVRARAGTRARGGP